MPTFVSPSGNREIWNVKPDGYFTTEEWDLAHPYVAPVITPEQEIAEHEAWLKEHDYIGIKIATGRATQEEYATEIAEMTRRANRIHELKNENTAL